MLKLSRFLSIFLLLSGVFFVAGCAADEPMSMPTHTPKPSATFMIRVTETAVATATFTAVPQPTETKMPTSLPTFTPTPEPVWHIFFSGAPCAATIMICDSNLFMGTEGGDYTINSDGSGFMPVADLPTMPTTINFVQFSPDGTQMAYTQYQDETRENRVIRLLNLDGSSPIDLGIQPSDWADIQFLPEPDCLAIFRRAGREDPLPEAETLTIEKWCVNQPPQLLEMVEFPELVPGWGYTWGDFKLSPDGNYLYGYSQEHEGNMALYLHRMGETSPPTLLYQLPPKYKYSEPSRWWPDNQTIEFIAIDYPETIFYTTNRVNGETNIRLTTTGSAISSPGEWSPGGGEFVFVYHGPNPEPAVSGLYIINLESGERRQLLDEFYSMAIRIWDPTQLPGFSGDN